MIIYQITLPQNQDIESFVTFMRDEYFPAVHRGQTRVGQVTGLILLERQNEVTADDVRHEFFWHIHWSGQPTGIAHVADSEVKTKFETFKANVKRLGSYEEVAAA